MGVDVNAYVFVGISLGGIVTVANKTIEITKYNTDTGEPCTKKHSGKFYTYKGVDYDCYKKEYDLSEIIEQDFGYRCYYPEYYLHEGFVGIPVSGREDQGRISVCAPVTLEDVQKVFELATSKFGQEVKLYTQVDISY